MTGMNPMIPRAAIALLHVLAVLLPAPLMAQPFPNKPVKLYVGFPPGGGSDALARLVALRFPIRWPPR